MGTLNDMGATIQRSSGAEEFVLINSSKSGQGWGNVLTYRKVSCFAFTLTFQPLVIGYYNMQTLQSCGRVVFAVAMCAVSKHTVCLHNCIDLPLPWNAWITLLIDLFQSMIASFAFPRARTSLRKNHLCLSWPHLFSTTSCNLARKLNLGIAWLSQSWLW